MSLLEPREEGDVPPRPPGHLLVEDLALDAHQPDEGHLPLLVADAGVGGHALGRAEEIGPRVTGVEDLKVLGEVLRLRGPDRASAEGQHAEADRDGSDATSHDRART